MSRLCIPPIAVNLPGKIKVALTILGADSALYQCLSDVKFEPHLRIVLKHFPHDLERVFFEI